MYCPGCKINIDKRIDQAKKDFTKDMMADLPPLTNYFIQDNQSVTFACGCGLRLRTKANGIEVVKDKNNDLQYQGMLIREEHEERNDLMNNKIINTVSLADEAFQTTLNGYFCDAAGELSSSKKEYTFKVPRKLADKLFKDDIVLVDSDYNSVAFVKVSEVHEASEIDPDADFAYKWAFQKLSGNLAKLKAREEVNVKKFKKFRQTSVKEQALTVLGGAGFEIEYKPEDTDED